MLVRRKTQLISEQRRQQLKAAKERYNRFQSERKQKVEAELARRTARKAERKVAAKEQRQQFYKQSKEKLGTFDNKEYLKATNMRPMNPKRNKVRDKMLTKSSYWSDFSYG